MLDDDELETMVMPLYGPNIPDSHKTLHSIIKEIEMEHQLFKR